MGALKRVGRELASELKSKNSKSAQNQQKHSTHPENADAHEGKRERWERRTSLQSQARPTQNANLASTSQQKTPTQQSKVGSSKRKVLTGPFLNTLIHHLPVHKRAHLHRRYRGPERRFSVRTQGGCEAAHTGSLSFVSPHRLDHLLRTRIGHAWYLVRVQDPSWGNFVFVAC